MRILHTLLAAALLVGVSNFAMASPDRGDHDRGQQRGHYDRGHGDHGRDRNRHDSRRWDDRHRYDRRPVVVRNVYVPRYAHGHGHWRRGYRYSGPTYVVRDYGYYRLRQPPRGYHWVRADNNDYLLVAIATGIIMDIAMR